MLFRRLSAWLPPWIADAITAPARPTILQRDPQAALTDSILRDIDQSMGDMAHLTHSHAGPEQMMPTRMHDLGLDPGSIAIAEAETYRALQDTCDRCTKWRRCARDLERGDARSGLDTYCANAEVFGRLLVERHNG